MGSATDSVQLSPAGRGGPPLPFPAQPDLIIPQDDGDIVHCSIHVIASEAKQSIAPQAEKMDCFVLLSQTDIKQDVDGNDIELVR
ncbi:hypothetical protein ABIB82_003728 [Bradyrhizobium sp. i1.8.4]|uniref:hypothetical protein n=1 Tax=unclassified Bradyrhizobium TaxID=2631580 RepID=UPI003D215CCA